MDDLLSRTHSRELRHEGEQATRVWLRDASDFGPISIYRLRRGRQRNARPHAARRDQRCRRRSRRRGRTACRRRLADADARRRSPSRARDPDVKDGRIYGAVAKLEGTFFSRLISRRPLTFWSEHRRRHGGQRALQPAARLVCRRAADADPRQHAPLRRRRSRCARRRAQVRPQRRDDRRSHPSSTTWPRASRR